jgi:hypothetical protein
LREPITNPIFLLPNGAGTSSCPSCGPSLGHPVSGRYVSCPHADQNRSGFCAVCLQRPGKPFLPVPATEPTRWPKPCVGFGVATACQLGQRFLSGCAGRLHNCPSCSGAARQVPNLSWFQSLHPSNQGIPRIHEAGERQPLLLKCEPVPFVRLGGPFAICGHLLPGQIRQPFPR